jgi:hypothetical protein
MVKKRTRDSEVLEEVPPVNSGDDVGGSDDVCLASFSDFEASY